MISAFGVEHGEISKGFPAGAKGRTAYAASRMASNKRGKLAAKFKAQGDEVTARRWRNNGRDARKASRLQMYWDQR